MRLAFAKALKRTRKARGLTQEDFNDVSSRTYLSSLERGQKSPTLDKVNTISGTLGIHFLSLMTLTYLYVERDKDLDTIFAMIRRELESVDSYDDRAL